MNQNLELKLTLKADGEQLTGTVRSGRDQVEQFNREVRSSEDAGRAGARGLDQLDGSARKTAGSLTDVRTVAGVLSGILAGLSIHEVVQYGDTWLSVSNQLKQVTDSSGELTAVQSDLVALSKETRSNFEATGNLYARLARATTEMHLSQQDLLGITRTINQSFALSGATAGEASAAITQLSQGLASGALRGDEFNSVAEQAPGILRAIAAHLDMGVGELREFAAEGGITAEIVVASLQAASDSIDSSFSQSVATFGQQMEVAQTNMLTFVANNDTLQSSIAATGEMIVTATGFLSENREAISLTASAALGAVAPYAAMQAALLTASAAQLAFNTVASANPYLLILGSVTAATAAIIAFRNEQSSAVEVWESATESEAAYQAAMNDVGAANRVQEIVHERIEAQTELDQLREKGFKQYSRDGERARQLQNELLALEREYHAITNARIAATKAHAERQAEQREAEAAAEAARAELLKQQEAAAKALADAQAQRIETLQEKELTAARAVNEAWYTARESLASQLDAIVAKADPLAGELQQLFRDMQVLGQAVEAGLISQEDADRIANILNDSSDDYDKWLSGLKDSIDPLQKVEEEIAKVWAAFDAGHLEGFDKAQIKAFTDAMREGAKKGGSDFEKQMLRTSERVASSLQNAIISGDWAGIGDTIGATLAGSAADLVGTQLTKTLSSSFSSIGMMAGPLGALGGALAGGLVGSLFGGSSGPSYHGEEYRKDANTELLGEIGDGTDQIVSATERTANAMDELVGLNRDLVEAQRQVVEASANLGYQVYEELSQLFASDRLYIVQEGRGRSVDPDTGQVTYEQYEIKRAAKHMDDLGFQFVGSLTDGVAKAFLDKRGAINTVTLDSVQGVLGNALDSIVSVVTEAGVSLGRSRSEIEELLGGINLDEIRKISTKGLEPEEIADRVNDLLAQIMEEATETVLPELGEFVDRIGEDYASVLQELATNNQVVTASLKGLNDSLEGLAGLDLARATEQIVHSSKSLGEFQSLTGSLIANFLPEEEQAALRAERLRKEFESLGVALPQSAEELVAYARSLDLTTEAGVEALLAIGRAEGDLKQFFEEMENGAAGALRSLTDTALAGLRASIDDRRQVIQEGFNDETQSIRDQMNARLEANRIALGAAQEGLRAIRQEIQGIESAAEALAGAYEPIQDIRRFDAVQTLREALASGDLAGAGEAASFVSDVDAKRFANRVDYEREQGQSLALLEALEAEGGAQLTAAEQSVAALQRQTEVIRRQGDDALDQAEQAYEDEMDALDQILAGAEQEINALRGIETGVLSIVGAIEALAAAMGKEILGQDDDTPMDTVEQLYRTLLGREIGQEGRDYWSGVLANGGSLADVEWSIRQSPEFNNRLNIPGFAAGGDHTGGWRVVGEVGPELEYTGPSRIYSNTQSRDLLDLSPVVTAIHQLERRLERIEAYERAISSNTGKTANYQVRFDRNGLKIREPSV